MKKPNDILTKKQAKNMLYVHDGMVHTFFNLSFGLIGGDHSKESVFKDIDKSFECRKTGREAQSMGHGLVIVPSKECRQEDLLFVETKCKRTNKLYELVGEVKKEINKK